MKKLYILSIALLSINIGNAQMINYNTANSGLVNDNIKQIAIDAQNNKWIGTSSGVSKFDGTNWTTYNTGNGLVNNNVLAIAIDAQGHKWFGTSNGVSEFDGFNWTTYNTGNGLVGNTVNGIAVDSQDHKWFGTNNGVSEFDGINWTTYTTSNSGLAGNTVNSIAIDTLGNKWFTCWDQGVSKFDGVNWTTYISGVVYSTIAADKQNNIWVGGTSIYTWGNGVLKFDGTNWITYNTSNSGIASNNVYPIAIDMDNNKWLGMVVDVAGASQFDDANWTTYNQANSGLAGNFTQCIAIDSMNNKWFGTELGVFELNNCGIVYPEEICYIEFDSASSKNSISWATNLPVNIDSIRVYKEISTNVWSRIGSVPSTENHFLDLNSNPFNQSYSYKITAIDTCGNESDSSAYHTTITLLGAYNQGTNIYGFTWSAYQGLAVANYYLYGITENGNETLIGTVNGNQYFYNYTNPDPGFTKFFVGFNTPTCTSKSDHLVKSNWVQSTTGIKELGGIDNLITLYPNPATENLTIETPQKTIIEILNIEGQIIKRLTLNNNNMTVDLSNLSSGVYIIKAKTDKGIAIKKFIKE